MMDSKQADFIRAIEDDHSLLQLTDFSKTTIFHEAAHYGHLQVMEAINNIDAQMKDRGDKDNETPLMTASYNYQAACVKWLLDHDADVNIKDVDGNTALDYANNKKMKKMIKEK